MIYIIGHKNSDTDCVCSSLAYARLKKQLGQEALAILAEGGLNKETEFVLGQFGISSPADTFTPKEDDQIILVDHNEPSQIDGRVNLERVLEIIDHHRLGGLSLQAPILVRIEPLGCTSTIIAKLYKENNIKISKEIASLLIAGIISDTLYFNSPTTTDKDKETVQELNSIASLNLDDLSQKMFKAKSDLTNIPISEILTSDYKNFDMSGIKLGIGVLETVDPGPALDLKDQLLAEMSKLKIKQGLDYIFFGVVDIISQKTYLLVLEGEEIIKKAFQAEVKDQIALLGEVVSRKKQIVPPLEKYFREKK